MPKVQIRQIYYDESTRKAVDPSFIALDNSANARPDWREYWPMRAYLLANQLEPGTHTAFLSPRFRDQAGVSAADVAQFLAVVGDAHDVVGFSPFPDQSCLFINVFEQGDYAYPGLASLCQDALDAIGMRVAITDVVMDSRNTLFRNYFAAKPAFWRQWLVLNEKLFAIAETPAHPLHARLTRTFTSRETPLGIQGKVLVMERMASLLLATDKTFKSVAYSPFMRPVTTSPFAQFPVEAVMSDALKIAGNETGDPVYRHAFGQIRAQIQKAMQESARPSGPAKSTLNS